MVSLQVLSWLFAFQSLAGDCILGADFSFIHTFRVDFYDEVYIDEW